MSMEPSLNFHSIEGVFALEDDQDEFLLKGPEVFDFDGIDGVELFDGVLLKLFFRFI